MSAKDVMKMIEDNEVKFVDFRFTDTIGKEHHVSVPAHTVNEAKFEEGQMFDGSSISGWKDINESDMILKPDTTTCVMDPFTQESTLIVRCDIVEPSNMQGYEKDPRSIAKRAEQYMQDSGIGDTAYFGNENEFFVFDSVKWDTGFGMGKAFYEIHSEEADWESGSDLEGGNKGHRPNVKGGYFPVPPVDSLHDLRSEMCLVIEEMGVETEVHHHEVGTAGQCEIGAKFNTLVRKADETQILKYCIHNVAHMYNKTATFMPKPIAVDNGNGMHVHQSIAKDGVNLFDGNEYGNLSQMALYYIGGIIKHARALNAFTNASTNSYKRLVPGYEAPEMLAYSAKNRSAAIRIPYVGNPLGRRIEVRFPDNTANPYLAFSAMLMAGLDGIKNKIDPGKPEDGDLYELTNEEKAKIPKVCNSLDQALDALDVDRDFLKLGGVFTDDVIDSFIGLKMKEVNAMRSAPHPVEFDMYYSL
ncbi:Glutamine synthetase type I [Bathymodiolus heckerae thiotrophic gill symbiont]|uniref:type I glutamate--ammonia ligase n=1 Tax=Bathymodiolus heckerae thiotrophic gill symbiont TaxID=1052212 RepID=UPI0010B7DBFB|nr:type I glutamate--ammonia ligase [Bathymodiolus heckerae thiotrophic gill symbiont]SHN92358.1 Glutamine synthetase type I [Bathymodiolus heckerae thiotrophic gill symbiont]